VSEVSSKTYIAGILCRQSKIMLDLHFGIFSAPKERQNGHKDRIDEPNEAQNRPNVAQD